ncbi:hypothetical protein Y1Q_0019709 [Alligator mississippiensis]|uniref:Uncharacterized protein n=1 Tax=Alligator mississippiensis TaxID=8496 RepID=A0A151PF40_ALLMI|nr:hypothetical protein Y1Q_0019709 [Alligator mississippiensis]
MRQLHQWLTQDWILLLQWLMTVAEEWEAQEKVWKETWLAEDVTWETSQEKAQDQAQWEHWVCMEAQKQKSVELLWQQAFLSLVTASMLPTAQPPSMALQG